MPSTLSITSDSEDDLESPVLHPLPHQSSQDWIPSPASSTDVIAAAAASTKDVSPALASAAATASITPAAKVKSESKKKKEENQELLKAAKLTDVLVSPSAVNSLQGNQTTRLISINGVLARECPTDLLRVFLSKYKSVGKSNTSKRKKALCDTIAQCWVDWEEGRLKLDSNGDLLNNQVLAANTRHSVNKMRFINVVYSDPIRPLLQERGRTLNKDELTSGIKQDQQLHIAICDEYNKPDKHNTDNFKSVGMPGSAELENKPITWQQSKEFMKTLMKAYEEVWRKWKQSGNHDDFDAFITSDKMRYLHYLREHDKSQPGYLQKLSSLLPSNVFGESIEKQKVSTIFCVEN